MEPSLLSGKLEVCVATLDHYFPLPSNCTALSALFWSEHKTWSLCFSGLYDTVFDVDTDKERAQARGLEPNGFSFDGADSRGVDYALNRQAQSRRAWFTELWQLFTHRSCLMLHLQGGLCLVWRPELVPLSLQEGHGARLVVEPACPGLHRALPFGVQILRN